MDNESNNDMVTVTGLGAQPESADGESKTFKGSHYAALAESLARRAAVEASKFDVSNYLARDTVERDARRYLIEWQLRNALAHGVEKRIGLTDGTATRLTFVTEDAINAAFADLQAHSK